MKKLLVVAGIAMMPGCISLRHYDRDVVRDFQLQQCLGQLDQANKIFQQIQQSQQQKPEIKKDK